MKNFTILLIVLFPMFLFSQTLNIFISDGTQHSIEISLIDSITFSDSSGGVGSGLPCPGTPTVTYENKTYNTVQIDTQCWLLENLDVGTMIQGNIGQTNNSIIEKYCYENLQNRCDGYGGLYQWKEVMQYVATEGSQGICPSGWHIPSIMEFQTLSAAVGGSGNALKALGQGVGAGAGTNTSGFAALLAGAYQTDIGSFVGLRGGTKMWSSTESGGTASGAGLADDNDIFEFASNGNMNDGFSIRCLKD